MGWQGKEAQLGTWGDDAHHTGAVWGLSLAQLNQTSAHEGSTRQIYS
jgi:hypothetical protein